MAPRSTLGEAWSILGHDPRSVLVDVRTTGEWSAIGVPDLAEVGKSTRLVEWQMFPDGRINPNFVAEATDGLTLGTKVLVLCRSGSRSEAAANVLVANGFDARNVVAGFEGQPGPGSRRVGGWKDALPWKSGHG